MKLTDLVPWRRESRSVPVRRRSDSPYDSLHREMDRMLERFFDDFDGFPFSKMGNGWDRFSPNLDLSEDEKNFVLSAELPGVSEKDLEISLSDDALTIKGEKKSESEDKRRDYYFAERSHGVFRRTIALPEGIDADKIEASLKDGVLKLTLPKSEEFRRKVKRIPVATG